MDRFDHAAILMTSLNNLLNTARQHMSDNRVDEASALLDSILDAAPDHTDALLLRGMADCHSGRLLDGLRRLDRALALSPPRFTLSDDDRTKLMSAGATAVAEKVETDPVCAARVLAALRTIGVGEQAEIHTPRLHEHLQQRAIGLYHVGDHLAAERHLHALLALAANHAEALGLLGLIRIAEGETIEAIALLARALPNSRNKALLKLPFDQAIRQTLNEAFHTLQADDLKETERRLSAVLAADPDNTIALTYYAMLESKRGAPRAALERVNTAFEKGARAQVIYRLACLMNSELGNFQEAAIMQTMAGDLDGAARLRVERETLLRSTPNVACNDLVLGAGFGYGVKELEPFVRTLRHVAGYNGDVILLVTTVGPDMIRFFSEHQISYIVCDSVGFIQTLPANARIIKYYDVLKQMRLEDRLARRILLTDVRDVIFQSDPFDYDYSDAIFYTLYAPDFRVSDSPVDLMWFRRAYGDAIADHVANLPLACCGTVLGTGAGILEYVSVFLEQYLGIDQGVRAVQFLDQTIHNYILHEGLVRPARILDNHDVIGTLMLGRRDFMLDADFRVTGLNGKIPSILHGYDRQPDMLAYVRQVYGGR